MKTLRLCVLSGLILLSALISRPTKVNALGCGLEPIELKPIPPLGCKDVYRACTCDNHGNCRWVWVCVKY